MPKEIIIDPISVLKIDIHLFIKYFKREFDIQ